MRAVPRVKVTCPCGKDFDAYEHEARKFCSRPCLYKYRKVTPKCLPGCECSRHRPDTPERAQNRREVMIGKNVGKKYGPPSDEHREKNRIAQLGNQHARGIKHTPEQRAHRANLTRQMWADGFYDDKGIPTRGKPGVHAGVRMRCLNSEGVFARELDRVGIAWQYEPRRFKLSWCTYLPDFYLPELDVWVEIKGYMTEEAQRKVDSFRSETGKTLSLIYCSELPYRFYQGVDQN